MIEPAVMINDEESLLTFVLGLVGLDVNNEGYVYDQDTGYTPTLKGKLLNITGRSRDNYYFNPIKSKPVSMFLFNYHIEKMTALSGIYVSIISNNYDKEEHKSSVIIVYNDPEKGPEPIRLESNKFHNINLAFIDTIAKLEGINLVIGDGMDIYEPNVQRKTKTGNRRSSKTHKK